MVSKKPHNTFQAYQHPHSDRVNIPEAGLVSLNEDNEESPTTYKFDPHIDPHIDWASKAERTSFEVPSVSLHIHERIEPLSIIGSFIESAPPPKILFSRLFLK